MTSIHKNLVDSKLTEIPKATIVPRDCCYTVCTKLTVLYPAILFHRLNNELDLIDTQQKELEEILGPLEQAVGSYITSTGQHTDQERKTT